MALEVLVETWANDAELATVRAAFRDAEVDAVVEARMYGRGASLADIEKLLSALPPWVVYMAVPSMTVFFASFAKSAGEEMGKVVGTAAGKASVSITTSLVRAIVALVNRLHQSRLELTGQPGNVILHLESRQIQVILPHALTEKALVSLTKIVRGPIRSVTLQWDTQTQRWTVVSDRRLRSLGSQSVVRGIQLRQSECK